MSQTIPSSPTPRPVILLADEQDALRGIARAVLSGAGYEVLEAADG